MDGTSSNVDFIEPSSSLSRSPAVKIKLSSSSNNRHQNHHHHQRIHLQHQAPITINNIEPLKSNAAAISPTQAPATIASTAIYGNNNRHELKMNLNLSTVEKRKDFNLSIEKLSTISIRKKSLFGTTTEKAKVTLNPSNYLSLNQKRNRFAIIKEMSRSHEVRYMNKVVVFCFCLLHSSIYYFH